MSLFAVGFGGPLTRGTPSSAAGVQDSGSAPERGDDKDDAKPSFDETHAARPHAEEHAAEPEHDEDGKDAKDAKEEHASHEFTFDAAARERLGIVLTTVKESTIQPELRAVGISEEDPTRSFTVRAPIAGFLQASGDDWPVVGAIIEDHSQVGAVQPRLTPLERFALAGQSLEARSALAEIEAELAAAQASYDSKRTLNADGKMVSDRQFEEAESKLKISRARLAGAQQKLALLEQQQSEVQRGLALFPLEAVRGGHVIEVLAAPGEAVESGQALLRLARNDRLIARIELPLGEHWDSPALNARVAVAGAEDQVVAGHTIGPSPRAGLRTRGQAWLLALDQAGAEMAPGTPLIAFLPTAGDPLKGVLVPSSAILRYGGLTWVFVLEEHDKFERQAVQLHSPTPDGWFVIEGLEPGTTIVERGAQVLLSEQLKAQIEAEAEAAE